MTPRMTSRTTSRTTLVALALVALAALVGAPASLAQDGEALAEHVVIVSVDGLRPDALERVATPTFDDLARRGSSARVAKTIFPSSTLPSHTSMLTGLEPRQHRVYWNSKEESKGLVESPTCLALVSRAGRRSAMVVAKDKLWHLSGGADLFEVHRSAREVTEAAIAEIRANRPALLFVHYREPDSVGHDEGWLSDAQLEAIGEVDRALGSLLDALVMTGISRTTAVIVSADHGGHAKTHGTWMDEDMLIPWIAAGPGIREGHRFDAAVTTYDTAATALMLLGVERPDDWTGQPVTAMLDR